MSKERYVEHTVAWELPIRDSVTKGNYTLADIETKYLPIQTEVVSDNKDKTINKLQQRIAELEEQLKNAIVPKFKVGDKVYAIIDTFAYTDVFPVEIRDTHLLYEVWDGEDTTKQHFTRIFATKEEAKAKLRELQGEKK